MVTKKDYTAEAVEAARSVLIELIHLLGEYRDHIQNYPDGIDALVEEFKPHIEHGLVKEGLEKIRDNFASEKHIGPKFVADFEELDDTEEREILERDVYEKVKYLLEKLGVR